MLSTPVGTSSRRAIQRVVISAATLMFITAIWWSISSSDTMLRTRRLGQAAGDEQRVSQPCRR